MLKIKDFLLSQAKNFKKQTIQTFLSVAALKLLIYTLQNTIYLELLLDMQAYYVAHIQRLSESTLIIGFLNYLLTLC